MCVNKVKCEKQNKYYEKQQLEHPPPQQADIWTDKIAQTWSG